MIQHNTWSPYDAGRSLGQIGTEHGIILHDEVHDDGARITLEGEGTTPFSITCGIYGWFFHTSFFTTKQSAMEAYAAMKGELARILDLIPNEDDPEAEQKLPTVSDALVEFTERF